VKVSLLEDLLEIAILGFPRKLPKSTFRPFFMDIFYLSLVGNSNQPETASNRKITPNYPRKVTNPLNPEMFIFDPSLEAYFQASDFMISAQA
jgi:hypothetical protein